MKKALVLLALTACWVPLEKGARMESDVVAVQAAQRQSDERAAAEQQKLEALAARLQSVNEQVTGATGAIQAKLDELNQTAIRAGANLGADMQRALGEIAILRGQLEEAQHQVRQMQSELETLRTVNEARLAKLESAPPPPPKPPEPSKEDLYEAALKKMESGETGAARAGFLQFRDKYRGDALAGNAQYWIGESYFAEKKYREAIVEFQRLREEFKKSDKAPDAMFKVGMAFVALGLKDDGVLFLEDVSKQYPKSAAAEKARAKIKEIRNGGGKRKK